MLGDARKAIVTLAQPVNEERISVFTTIRLLFRPEAEANLISERIVNGEPFRSQRSKRTRDMLVAAGVIVFFPVVAFFLLPIMWLFSGAIMAAMSAILTSRELQQGLLREIVLTSLSDCDIIMGLADGVLRRMDNWRRSVITAQPFIAVVGLAFTLSLVESHGWTTTLLVATIWIMLTVGIVGTNILGVSVGVWFAARLRNLNAAPAGAGVMVAVVVAALIGFVLALRVEMVALLAAAALMVLPYLLATLTLNQSRRWIREIV